MWLTVHKPLPQVCCACKQWSNWSSFLVLLWGELWYCWFIRGAISRDCCLIGGKLTKMRRGGALVLLQIVQRKALHDRVLKLMHERTAEESSVHECLMLSQDSLSRHSSHVFTVPTSAPRWPVSQSCARVTSPPSACACSLWTLSELWQFCFPDKDLQIEI